MNIIKLDEYSDAKFCFSVARGAIEIKEKRSVGRSPQYGHSLSAFELDRIWAEGTMATVRYLTQHVLPTDPILVKLANRWDFPLSPIDPILI